MVNSNMTSVFEGTDNLWPGSGEHFWTALFAIFALHLASTTPPRAELSIWHPTGPRPDKKYYMRRAQRPRLRLEGVSFESLTVEPQALSKPWPGPAMELPASAGGFSPDMVIRSQADNGGDHFVIIENKVTYAACLAGNQMQNYPRLAEWLLLHGVSFDLLFLQSVGCCNTLHDQARTFQSLLWGDRFGVLLWEEAVRLMSTTGFSAPGLPIGRWQQFTAALDTDCVDA